MLIKICGCREPEDARAAIAAGADAVGMIFVPGARRRVGRAEAHRLVSAVAGDVLTVGVFADQMPAEILDVASDVGLDAIQLHGTRDEGVAEGLGSRFLLLRAWSVGAPVPAVGDWILAEGRGPGGSGQSWDWSQASGLGARLGRPILLAGGLTPENVADVIAVAQPDAVDVSTGVETQGRKDPERILAFCEAVRGCGHGQGRYAGWRAR